MAESKFPSAAVAAARERCGPKHPISGLEEEERWDHVLSVGEEQRLAFTRLLLHRPGLDAFHDRTLTLVDAVGGARAS